MKEGTAFPPNEGAEKIRQLAWGYIPAALIGVIIELGVPDLLGEEAKPISQIAAAVHANENALYRMLRTLASFGIFTETTGRHFALTSAGKCLRSDVPNSLRGYVRWITSGFLFRNYSEFMHSAKTGEPVVEHLFGKPLFGHLQANPELSQVFNDAMTSFSQVVSKAVLGAYDFSGIKVLADVAGGEGALLGAILQKYPAMNGLLLEQEHVLPGARKRFQEAGLADRARAMPVNFFEDVPAGADAYLMKSIIHDWYDDRAGVILKNCSKALRNVDHGKLILVEGVIPPGNDPHMAKLSDMQMLLVVGGRERTREGFQALLDASGFRLTSITPTETFVSVIEAVPQ